MGLFDSKTDEDHLEEMLANNNVFEGVKCEVIFPNKQLQIATSSGLKKGAATLAFGLVGLAATSRVKQEEKKRTLKTLFQIVEKGIVFKKATENGEDLRIPYENIVVVKKICRKSFKTMGTARKKSNKPKPFAIKLILLKNQEVIVNFNDLRLYSKSYFIKHIITILNERVCGAQYEEKGWGLEHATAEPQETKQEKGSLMDELERLGTMYEKGLLTDEEFALAKKKLLEGD